MPELKKLIVSPETLPPAKIILNGSDVKQVVDSNNTVLWGHYLINNSTDVQTFIDTYCDSFELKFKDPTSPSGLVVKGLDANRNFILNKDNIAYHGENLECNYKLKIPYYITINPTTNAYITSYSSPPTLNANGRYSNEVDKDFIIKTYAEDPAQEWPVFKSDLKVGILSISTPTGLNFSNATRTASPYGKASTGSVTNGTKLYYGDVIKATWTHSSTGKLPISGKQYTFELRGDGTDENGQITQNDQHYKNGYLFLANQSVVLTPSEFNYPIYIYSNGSWYISNDTIYVAGMLAHHTLIRGEQIPVWLCCNTENFGVSGPGLDAEATWYATSDYRKYAIYDTSVPLYQGDVISRSNGNPFKNENGYTILGTTLNPNWYKTSASGQILSKPTHCYLAYIYDDKIYKIDLLNNTTSLVIFNSTLNTSGSYLEANDNWKALQVSFPRLEITAPLHIAGNCEVVSTVKIYDASKNLVISEDFTKSVSFTNLNNPVTVLNQETRYFANYNFTVSSKHTGSCTTVYKFYDTNKNLIYTGSTSWNYNEISNYW